MLATSRLYESNGFGFILVLVRKLNLKQKSTISDIFFSFTIQYQTVDENLVH